MIRTAPYRIDFADLQRVMLRGNYRRFAWLSASSLALGALILAFMPEIWLAGAFSILLGVSAPYLRTLSSMSKVKKTPLQMKEYVAEFDDRELRQFADGELASRVKYADLVATAQLKEGFQIWVSPLSWILVPVAAFAAQADLSAARTLVEQARAEKP